MRSRKRMVEMLETLKWARKKYKTYKIMADDIGIGLSTLVKFRDGGWNGSYPPSISDETMELVNKFLDSIYKKKKEKEVNVEKNKEQTKCTFHLVDFGEQVYFSFINETELIEFINDRYIEADLVSERLIVIKGGREIKLVLRAKPSIELDRD